MSQIVRLSCRPSVTKRPSIRRGNSAIPFAPATVPVSGRIWNETKSVVDNSSEVAAVPLKAV